MTIFLAKLFLSLNFSYEIMTPYNSLGTGQNVAFYITFMSLEMWDIYDAKQGSFYSMNYSGLFVQISVCEFCWASSLYTSSCQCNSTVVLMSWYWFYEILIKWCIVFDLIKIQNGLHTHFIPPTCPRIETWSRDLIPN